MEKIHVAVSGEYDVSIGAGLLEKICALVPFSPRKSLRQTRSHLPNIRS